MRQAVPDAFLGAIALATALACAPAHAAPPWAATHTLKADVGDAVPGALLAAHEPVRVAVVLALRNKPELDALATALMSGHATRHLTSAEVLARHAPTQAQADAVAAHLRASGFTSVHVAQNRLVIVADGDAAAVRAAFDTQLQHFRIDGRDARANLSDARVPAHLAGLVTAVTGLQTVHVARPANRLAGEGVAAAVGHQATDFSTIYDGDGLPPASKATIGIIAQGDVSPTLDDLRTFTAAAGFAMPATRVVVADSASSDTSNVIEWDIDSQSSLATAGGQIQSMNFYVASTLDDAPLTAAYNAAVVDNTAQVINVSLQGCETSEKQSGAQAAQDAVFEVAVAQGQVFSIASGDRGSYQCGSKLGGASWPSASPYVISVGGTTLQTTGNTVYASETLWSCTGAIGCELGGGAGGGPSVTEAAPQWQIDAGLDAAGKRAQPDVSFDADPNTGMLVTFGNQHPQYGGTSLASPIFVGFWARLQSQNNLALGYPAAPLYKVGPTNNGKKFLHDVTSGSNGGYSAGPGFDAASGFGSMDIGKLSQLIRRSKGL